MFGFPRHLVCSSIVLALKWIKTWHPEILFFAVHPTSACVCPSVLLPTQERLAGPPPVPSRHQLIYQKHRNTPVTFSTGFVQISSLSLAFCGEFWHNTYKTLYLCRYQIIPGNNESCMFRYYCRWIGSYCSLVSRLVTLKANPNVIPLNEQIANEGANFCVYLRCTHFSTIKVRLESFYRDVPLFHCFYWWIQGDGNS